MSKIVIYQSVTQCLSDMANILTVRDTDSTRKKYAKLAVGTPIYTALAMGGFIESFFRIFLAMLAKIATFFIPKEYAEKLDNKLVHPLIEHVQITLIATVTAAVLVITRFTSRETRRNINIKMASSIERPFVSKFMNGLRNIHINGFVQPKRFVITSPQATEEGYMTRAKRRISNYVPAKLKTAFSY